MRKKRAILFDDEPIVLDVLRMFFEARGYEILAFREPVVCAIYGDGGECRRQYPCSDVMITDYRMPKMNGADLLLEQRLHGCKLTPRNKALLSGFADSEDVKKVTDLGVTFFQKPVDFKRLGTWLDGCEQRVDLRQRLGVRRRETRYACGFEVYYGNEGGKIDRRADAMNMSESGLCLRTDSPLLHQQRIAIATNARRSLQLASVRWVEEKGPGDYLVGLDFNG